MHFKYGNFVGFERDINDHNFSGNTRSALLVEALGDCPLCPFFNNLTLRLSVCL